MVYGVDISDGSSALAVKRIRHRNANFPTKRETKDYKADYGIHHLNQLQISGEPMTAPNVNNFRKS